MDAPVFSPPPASPSTGTGAPPSARQRVPRRAREAAGGSVPEPPLTARLRGRLIAALIDALSRDDMERLTATVFDSPDDIFNPIWIESTIAVNIVRAAEAQRLLRELQAAAMRLNADNELLNNWYRLATGGAGSPYRWPFALREDDADIFFGRGADVDQLVEAVSQCPVVTVTGASGCGKSSVVFAGLARRLRDAGGWVVVSCQPGNDPFKALASCLVPLLEPELRQSAQIEESGILATKLRERRIAIGDVLDRIRRRSEPPSRLLLIADQFEELFAPTLDDAERDAFLDMLLLAFPRTGEQPAPAVLAAVMRADGFARALQIPSLATALAESEVMLGPMGRDDLQRAIEGPAGAREIVLEKGLTELVLDLVGDQPGNVALLAFTLTYLANADLLAQEMRQRPFFLQVPQVEAAFIENADDVVAKLGWDGDGLRKADALRRVVSHLVRPDAEGTVFAPRPASRREVGDAGWALVERLAAARLVVSDRDDQSGEGRVQFAHDALVRRWPRLRNWVNQDVEFLRWLDRLRGELAQWEAKRGQPGEADLLLERADLVEAEKWRNERESDLSAAQVEFIAQSVAKREAAQQAAALEQRRALNRRTGLAAAILAAGVLVAFVLGRFWQDAVEARAQANAAKAQAASQHLAQLARDRIDDQLDLALLLGVEAMRTKDTPEAEDGLQRALSASPYLSVILAESGEPVTSLAFSPTGSEGILASGSSDGSVTLWDLASKRGLCGAVASELGIRSLAFSPNTHERLLAAGTGDGSVVLWEIDGSNVMHERARLVGGEDTVTSVAFTLDGQTFAAGNADGTVRMWVRDDSGAWGARVLQPGLADHDDTVTSIAFSRDGQALVAGDAGGKITFWDVATGDRKGAPLPRGQADEVWSLAYRPRDARVLAVGGTGRDEGRIVLWDPVARRSLAGLGQATGVSSIAFNADGKKLASGGWDDTVIVWTVNRIVSDRDNIVLAGHDARVTSVAFAPDGHTLASSAVDGAVLLWDTSASISQAVAPAQLMPQACGRANRSLTAEEWDQYLPEEPYDARVCR